MAWSPNFCLNCDNETPERHYCSQSCRLADYEKSALSAPVSPGYDPESTISFSMSTANRSNIKFQLPPAFDFSAYRHGASRIESPPLSPRGAAQTAHQHSYSSSMHQTSSSQGHAPLHRTPSDYTQVRQRSLNTSTSRSSLSSVSSTGTTTSGLSDQALSQLQNYSNSFDHSRDWKRRITLG